MYALVLEDGRRWGEAAVPIQRDDIEAIFSPGRPNMHFLTRPRGGSKTSDIAGMALSWIAVAAPAKSRGYVVASNADQAAILIDAASAFVSRTPELEGVVEVEAERIVGTNGAWVKVLPQSDAGSWGLRDTHLIVADEFAQWPDTRGAKRVYSAIRSTVQKVPGCRFIILTSAGEPSHWSFEIFQKGKNDPYWRVSEMEGPVPWQDPEDIDALRRELAPSEFDRLVMNIWSEGEDRAVSEEDYEAASVLFGSLQPREGVSYIITLDVGIYNDATVICVAHREPLDPMRPDGPQRVVVDHLQRWKGSKKRPVQIREVIETLASMGPRYNRATVFADPDQAVGIVQELCQRGVNAKEWQFTTTSVGKIATALVLAFRNRQIHIPDTPALREELLSVRLRETTPGVTRLDHDKGAHDDQAVVIGMATHMLLGEAAWGVGHGWMESMKRAMDDPLFGALGAKAQPMSLDLGERPSPRSSCTGHRYFGPERMCALCGHKKTA